MAGPVSAATVLDFTTGAIGTGNLVGTAGGTNYTISGVGGALVDATHTNTVGCASTGSSWGTFACNDVGFGVFGGTNNNEIEGGLQAASEYVMVKFDSFVKILGFAGMLTYINEGDDGGNSETVILEYSNDGGSSWFDYDEAVANYNTAGGTFDTVGLAFLENLSVIANAVRFTAGGDGDDIDTNVTAAGLIVAAVPVPASFPLLLAGIGALGFAARRKRRNAA